MGVIGSVDFGPGICVMVVDHDPTTTPTEGNKGCMIIVKSAALPNDGSWYRKVDDGITTNVVLVSG